MKNFLLSGALIAIVLFSCNSDDSSHDKPSKKQDEFSIQIPATACFRSVNGKDTVQLKVETFPNVITGTLSYQLNEKDKNSGDIEGIRMGDTLLADYSFTSEGIRSTRQVIFLLKENGAVEGHGEMIEEDGKMMFKSLSNIDFTKSIALELVSCVEDVEVQQLSGDDAEKLYKHKWMLSAINGQNISVDKPQLIPNLTFLYGDVNSVSGTTGCNRLTGSFEILPDNQLKFSPVATTKMACIDENIENEFLEAFAKVDRFSFANDGSLVLYDNNNVVLQFYR